MAAQSTLLILMIFGGMAGSTAGGMKLSRVMIAVKGAYVSVRRLIDPHYVPKVKVESKTMQEKTVNDVFCFVTLYFFILMSVTLLLSFDPINGQTVRIVSDAGEYTVTHGLASNFSSALACISNIGPAFEALGPYSSYMGYSALSKILLMLTMLVGRLEIFPVLVLFSARTWKKT